MSFLVLAGRKRLTEKIREKEEEEKKKKKKKGGRKRKKGGGESPCWHSETHVSQRAEMSCYFDWSYDFARSQKSTEQQSRAEHKI